MVVIRLARGGSKKKPFYDIVATQKSSPRDGRFIEQLGYFNPVARGQAKRIEINKDRIEHWVSQGAQMSERAMHIYKEFLKDPEAAAAAKKIEKPAPKKNAAKVEAEAPAEKAEEKKEESE